MLKITVKSLYRNKYSVAPNIFNNNSPNEPMCYIDEIDMEYTDIPKGKHPEHLDSDSDEEHLLSWWIIMWIFGDSKSGCPTTMGRWIVVCPRTTDTN